jgi:hypothetical protein
MIKVKLTQTIQTQVTGIVLPAGLVGSIVHYQHDIKNPFYMVDFGLVTVLKFPANSLAIQILGISQEGVTNGR